MLNDRPIRITRAPIIGLLVANSISQVGNVLTFVAVPWFVLETSGSAAKTGLTGFFDVLPVVIAGLLGGALVDRLGHRRSSIIADVVSGVTVVLIPLLYATVGLPFWQLLVLVFFGSLLDMPGSTARQSLVPELAELGQVSLERINSAYQSIQQGAFLIGPPLAGLLIATVGATNVLLIDGASFAISALLVTLCVPHLGKAKLVQETSTGYLADMIDGWRFIRRERVIFSLTIANAMSNFIGGPLFAVILPVYAAQTLGSSVDLGMLLSGATIGTLLGSVLYGFFGRRMSRRWIYAGAWLIGALPFWIMASTPPLIIAVGALAVIGLSDGPINPLMYTISQERTPPTLRGRVFGARIALANVAAPFGMLITGYLIAFMGLSPTLMVLALLYVITSVGVLLSPALHDLDRVPASGIDVIVDLRAAPDRPRNTAMILPHRRLLSFAALLLGASVVQLVIGERGPWTLLAGVQFTLAWLALGAGLRPFGSHRVGIFGAELLYLLIGLTWAVVNAASSLTVQFGTHTEHMNGLTMMMLVVIAWPIALIQVLGFRRTSS